MNNENTSITTLTGQGRLLLSRYSLSPLPERERKMKHTKGKWEVNESDGVLTIVCTDLNNRKYYIGDVNGDADYEPTYRANANLIAAAPELLQEYKNLVGRVSTMKKAMNRAGLNRWTKDWLGDGILNGEVIAKAEGK